jgi:hypothetical protein
MSPARDPLQGEPAGIEVVSTRTFPDDPGPPTSPGLSRGASASFRLYPLAFRKPSLRARGRAIRPKEATSRPWGWVRSPYPFTRAPPACGWKSAPAWTIRTERLGGDYELSVRSSNPKAFLLGKEEGRCFVVTFFPRLSGPQTSSSFLLSRVGHGFLLAEHSGTLIVGGPCPTAVRRASDAKRLDF